MARTPISAPFRRASSWVVRVADGIPASFVAALAALVLVAILYTVASHEPNKARAYAEFTLTRGGCTVDAHLQQNVLVCQRVSPGTYRLVATKSLAGATVVAGRGSCCPGTIGASIESDRTVLVVVPPRIRQPIRASVFIP